MLAACLLGFKMLHKTDNKPCNLWLSCHLQCTLWFALWFPNVLLLQTKGLQHASVRNAFPLKDHMGSSTCRQKKRIIKELRLVCLQTACQLSCFAECCSGATLSFATKAPLRVAMGCVTLPKIILLPKAYCLGFSVSVLVLGMHYLTG